MTVTIKEAFAKTITEKRAILVVGVYALLFGLSCSLPLFVRYQSFKQCIVQGAIVALPIFGIFIAIASVLKFFSDADFWASCDSPSRPAVSESLLNRVFFITFLVLVLLWGVALLGTFPGYSSVDSRDILKMVLGMPIEDLHFRYDGINNHHPVLYTSFVWVFMKIGSLIGLSEINSVGLVAFAQLVLFAACCSLGNMKLFELSRSKLLLVLSTFFYVSNPLLALYSVTLWKDILFAGVFLDFVVLLGFLALKSEEFWKSKTNIGMLFASGFLSMLLRSNGVMVIALSLVVVIVFSAAKKKIIILTACVVIPALLIVSPLYRLMGIRPAHFSEIVGIPLQQVARTIMQGGASDEQKEFFSKIMPLEEWIANYNEATPNGVKFAPAFNDDFIEAHKGEFIVKWLLMGFENKRTYLAAWIAQTETFWSVNGTTWYLAPPGYSLGTRRGRIYENRLGGWAGHSNLKALFEIQKSLLPQFFNVAALCWFLMLVFALQILNKSKMSLLCLVPLVALWVTYLLATPSNDYRYILPVFLCVPQMLYILMRPVLVARENLCRKNV